VFKELVGIENDTFNEPLRWLAPTYPKLVHLFASAFPATGTVASDFSMIGFEKDEYRSCMRDSALGGTLQANERYRVYQP
jgi:hypothetical protein